METLNEIERRVLGCLLEKSLAAPEYYPMTLNLVTAACNQKNNRDPAMELDEDSVWHTLEQLRQRGLVSRVLPAPGARTDRFKHEVDGKWQWPKAQKAVMTELLLRGPQTVGELRTRASRMYAFENLEATGAVLDWLASQTPPLIEPLPRAPGQSAIRFTHLLYPPEELAAVRSSSPAAAAASPSSAGQSASGAAVAQPPAPPLAQVAGLTGKPSAVSEAAFDMLREQLEGVQAEVAELHELVSDLRRRLDSIEGR